MSSLRLGALLLNLALAGSLSGESFAQTPAPTASSAASAESQVQRILTKQQIAWNIGDSASWGSAFAEDADFININGQVFHGREAIRQLHATTFAGQFKGSHTRITMRQFRQITPDVVLVEALHEVTNFKSLPPGINPTEGAILKARSKYVLIKRDDLWQIIAAQNTAILPLAAGEVH
jgi:uncharacterized protein (TIGR02246 family)